MKSTVFWGLTMCHLVDISHCYGEACCSHLQSSLHYSKLEAAGSSKTLVNIYWTR
jgi:hypothetical protein